MPSTPTDLRGLSRSHLDASVPPPRSRWATRVLLPFVIVVGAGAVLLYAARDALRPAIDVYVTPVIPKVVATGQTAGSSEQTSSELGAVLVQAPGWVEPDPYAISVPALAEGVVKEVLVLEGQHVSMGQVVVRLIDDDVRLQLRTIEAVLNERRADIERAEAAVVTAQAQVLVEQSAVVELRDEVTRKRELVKSGTVSIGEFRRLEIREAGLQARRLQNGLLMKRGRH